LRVSIGEKGKKRCEEPRNQLIDKEI